MRGLLMLHCVAVLHSGRTRAVLPGGGSRAKVHAHAFDLPAMTMGRLPGGNAGRGPSAVSGRGPEIFQSSS